MDTVTLEIFKTVATELSITRAAVLLKRVQSNVTTRIQNLELELEVDLFNREEKKLRLTEQGIVFLQYTNRMLALANEARQAMHPQSPQGMLRVGSMESTAASHLPSPLCKFHQAFPLVNMHVTTGATQKLVELLERGEIDCALLAPPGEVDCVQTEFLDTLGFEGEAAYEETLRIVMPKGYTEEDLVSRVPPLPLAAFQKGCSYRFIGSEWFASHQGAASSLTVNEVGSYHVMMACVAAGQSFSIVPQSVLDLCSDLGSVQVCSSIQTTTWLVWRAGYSTAAFRAFKGILQDSYSEEIKC
ncbi:LysR substrate-binding domain-containing protein [Pseudomonas sp. NPDC087804]|uniref:LysR substrate-binding domain-containing protein n=1 Tax=Pseudomonas sp. NPDC087804 TaxID=3364449 RepID=UPI003815FA3C